ncbi:UNVERIFIED_CONTAM: hypothetical protein K2H54_068181 [Gekko kuhli]
MAIAHIATEYVFSDFLLKEPSEVKYKGLRLELAVDKLVTCIAVGLPLLLISLAFAQEISIGQDTPFGWVTPFRFTCCMRFLGFLYGRVEAGCVNWLRPVEGSVQSLVGSQVHMDTCCMVNWGACPWS